MADIKKKSIRLTSDGTHARSLKIEDEDGNCILVRDFKLGVRDGLLSAMLDVWPEKVDIKAQADIRRVDDCADANTYIVRREGDSGLTQSYKIIAHGFPKLGELYLSPFNGELYR